MKMTAARYLTLGFLTAAMISACTSSDNGETQSDGGPNGGDSRDAEGEGGTANSTDGGSMMPNDAGANNAGASGSMPDSGTAGSTGDSGVDSSRDSGVDAHHDGGVDDDAATGADAAGNLDTTCGTPEPSASPGNACHSAAPAELKLTEIVPPGGSDVPVMLVSPPGDDRLFVVERGGLVRILEDGAFLAEPFLDLSEEIEDSGPGTREYGLLGLAFDPAFAENGRVWVHYNEAGDRTSITASVLVSEDDANRADETTLTTLFAVPQSMGIHKGGMIDFGPDGCLYVSLGDDGDSSKGQTVSDPYGAILRLDHVNNRPAPGNPDFDDPRVWSYGLRNPWRFSFDRDTGDLYIGDVGAATREEINIEPAGTGSHNYGWDTLEGSVGEDPGGTRDPALEYEQEPSRSTVIGGRVYRGNAIPDLVGRYLYADFITERVWSLTYSGENADAQPAICDQYELTADLELPTEGSGGITAFGEDAAGELYVLRFSGSIYRIDAE